MFNVYLFFILSKTVFSLNPYCLTEVHGVLRYGISNSISDICSSNTSATVRYFETIRLFQQLNTSQMTTFYECTCGLPLFVAPVGRSFDQWRNDCERNGQLEFQEEEIIKKNTKVLQSGDLVSICGRHVGKYTTSSTSGDVYVANIACISGSPIHSITTPSALNGSTFNPGFSKTPGNGNSLVGAIIIGSLGVILFLLSIVSCCRWCMRQNTEYDSIQQRPLKLLLLEDEKSTSELLKRPFTVTVTPSGPKYFNDFIFAAGNDSSHQSHERSRVDGLDEADKDMERVMNGRETR